MPLPPLRLIHHQLRTGETTATALVESCIDAYTATEKQLHAYKTWNGDSALQQAKAIDTLIDAGFDLGPLMGIPVSAKDLFVVPPMPTFAGTTQPLDGWNKAGPVVRSVQSQLGIITGKTHTVEFAFGGIGINPHWGTPRNPWDAHEHRIPGGSSSGAGVSLVQGSALLALGTDTAGSVRIPASLTGTAALKVTQGRWSGDGIVPLSSSLDSPGLLARTIADLAFAYEALDPALTGKIERCAPLHSLKGVRIGIPDNFFWDGCDPSIAAIVEDAIRRLETAGADVSRMTMNGCDAVYDVFKTGGLGAPELSEFLASVHPDQIDQLDPIVRMRVEAAETMTSNEYLRRVRVLRQASAEAVSIFDDFDVLLTPTVPISPPTVDSLADTEAYRHTNMMVLRNTAIANLMTLSSISMPVGKDQQNMPVGLQLMAGPWQEARLLAIAGRIEQELGQAQNILGTPPSRR